MSNHYGNQKCLQLFLQASHCHVDDRQVLIYLQDVDVEPYLSLSCLAVAILRLPFMSGHFSATLSLVVHVKDQLSSPYNRAHFSMT